MTEILVRHARPTRVLLALVVMTLALFTAFVLPSFSESVQSDIAVNALLFYGSGSFAVLLLVGGASSSGWRVFCRTVGALIATLTAIPILAKQWGDPSMFWTVGAYAAINLIVLIGDLTVGPHKPFQSDIHDADRKKCEAELVWIDSAPETSVPELALDALVVPPGRRNCWLRPIVTADALGAFLDASRRNDPNRVWGWATEVGDTLVVTRSVDEAPGPTFPQVGVDANGKALYDLTGWAWTTSPQPAQSGVPLRSGDSRLSLLAATVLGVAVGGTLENRRAVRRYRRHRDRLQERLRFGATD